MKPDLIGLCGVSGSGKDTIGKSLCDSHGFVRVAVADPIKEVLMTLFDLNRDQLWGDRRNEFIERIGGAPRQLFQEFGDFCEAMDPEVWMRPLCRHIAQQQNLDKRVVVTDVRTEHAAETVRRLGGKLWLVRRPGSGAPGALGQHRHECELSGKPAEYFDHVIDNFGTKVRLAVLIDIALLGGSAKQQDELKEEAVNLREEESPHELVADSQRAKSVLPAPVVGQSQRVATWQMTIP